MVNIFLSYESGDRQRIQPVVAGLQAEGWALWVIEEADHGKRKGALIPLLLDEVDPPLGFRTIHAADLVGWSGDLEAPAWQELVASIRELLGDQDPGALGQQRPTDGHALGFKEKDEAATIEKQKHAVSSLPLGPPVSTKRRLRTWLIGLSTVALLLAIVSAWMPWDVVVPPKTTELEEQGLEEKVGDMSEQLTAANRTILDLTNRLREIEGQTRRSGEPNEAVAPAETTPSNASSSTPGRKQAGAEQRELDPQVKNAREQVADAKEKLGLAERQLAELKMFRNRDSQSSSELDAQIAKLESTLTELRTNTSRLASLSRRI